MKANWILFPALLLQGMLITSTYGSNKYINTPCGLHTDCGLNNHLQCIENICQCDSNSQIYDQSTEKCLLLIGQQCQIHNHDYQYNRQHSIPIKCVPNSDCTNSVCRCKPGYRFSPDFLCKPDFGSPCYASDDCDDSLGLICSYRGICDCYNTTLTYQGQFGCVDPQDPTFNEMLRLLNQTEHLLKENNLELKDMFNDLGLQNDLNESGEEEEESVELRNVIADERQFRDTYNTNDLQFAAQNQAPQMSGGGGGGFNFQQLLSLFQTFRSLIPPRNNGGGGGFFRNLFGGGNNNNNQGGYADSSPPPPANGYGPPGQAEMGQRMGLLNSFINLFNQMIPIVRQLRMRFMPLRFFRNLLNRFAPSTTAAPPTAQSIANPPPSVIESNGNYQQNPIFGGGNGQAGPAAGTFRFFMRTRDRFRNFLRGNNQGGSQGGYSYPPGNSYGPPGETPPPADTAQPTSGGEPTGTGGEVANTDDGGAGPSDDTPPPPAPAPASSAQHNTYLNNHRPPPSTTPHRSHNNNNNNNNQFHGQQSQAQYNTINVGGHQAIPPPHPTQRQQQNGGGSLPRPATYNSGNRPNHESFYDGRQQSQQQTTTAAFTNNHANNHHNNNQHNSINSNQHNNNNINAQATSHHHQSTFVAHHQQSGHQPQHPQPPQQQHNLNNNNNGNFQHGFQSSSSNTKARLPFPSIGSATPPPIPQFKLQIPHSAKIPSSSTAESSLSENFILSEADDPHPGFTPLSTLAPPPPPHLESYRTSARFERIGGDQQQHHATSIAQNWRETF